MKRVLMCLIVGWTAVAVAGCDGITGSTDSGTSTPATFSLSGLVLGDPGTTLPVPLEGVTVFTLVEKTAAELAADQAAAEEGEIVGGLKRIETLTDAAGLWVLTGVPSNPLTGPSAVDLPIFFQKPLWVLDLDSDGPPFDPGIVFESEPGNGGLNIYTGAVTLIPANVATGDTLTLQVTSNLIHALDPATLDDIWLDAGEAAGTSDATQENEAYLTTVGANITLVFNLEVDTTYSDTDFAEIYGPDGTAVAFTGTWDETGTVFTIDPDSDLTADNDDGTKYHLRIARKVRAFLPMGGAVSELDDVDIYFNVFSTSHEARLATQAPTFDPRADGRTGYVVDSGRVIRRDTRNGSQDYTNTDRSGATDLANANGASPANNSNLQSNLIIQWPAVVGGREYRLYFRNTKEDIAGEWTRVLDADTSDELTILDSDVKSDDTFETTLVIFPGSESGATEDTTDPNSFAGSDAVLTNGEQIKVLVTSVDADGNESSVAGLSTPLTIADTFGPVVTGGSYDPDSFADGFSSAGERAYNVVTGDITITFQEAMETDFDVATPALSALSGLASISVPSEGMWWSDASTLNVEALQHSFTIASTTLGSAAPETTLLGAVTAGDTSIPLASVGGLSGGDVVVVSDGTNSESVVISTRSASSFSTTLSAAATAGASSITVADAVSIDDGGFIYLESSDGSTTEVVTVNGDVSNGTTINLTGTLANSYASGDDASEAPTLNTDTGLTNGYAAGTPVNVTVITVAAVGTFMVGDILQIEEDSTSERATITDLNTAAGTITISAGLTNGYGSGAAVRLAEGGTNNVPGLTDYRATVAENADSGDESVSVNSGEGNRFVPGMTVSIYRIDDNSTNPGLVADTLTVDSVDSSTISFTSALTNGVPEGSLIIPSGNTTPVPEPQPRGATSTTLQSGRVVAFTAGVSSNLDVTTLPSDIVVGDTVVLDTDQDSFTVSDRIVGTIERIASANSRIRITANTSVTRIVDTADVIFMGDAITVTGALDSNGNAMQTTFDMRVNPTSGTVQ